MTENHNKTVSLTIHPKRNVVIVGLLNNDNKILMIRNRRFPDYWMPIGGGMEEGETDPIQALIREVEEEVNISIRPDFFKFIIQTNYDFGEGTVYFYTAMLPQSVQPKFNTDELLEHKWVSLSSAKQLNMLPATQKFIGELEKSK